MTTHPESQSLPAPTSSWSSSVLPAQIVDRETALELRRTTRTSAVRDKRRPRAQRSLDLTCPPTIRTLDVPSESAAPVSVVIVPAAPMAVTPPSPCAQIVNRIKLDLSWMSAVAVALSVTLALAIPLELFRQNG